MSDENNKLSKAVDDPLSANRDPNKKEWVKFEEENDHTDVPKSELKVELFLSREMLFMSMNHLHVTAAALPNNLWLSRNPRNRPKISQQCWTPSLFM